MHVRATFTWLIDFLHNLDPLQIICVKFEMKIKTYDSESRDQEETATTE